MDVVVRRDGLALRVAGSPAGRRRRAPGVTATVVHDHAARAINARNPGSGAISAMPIPTGAQSGWRIPATGSSWSGEWPSLGIGQCERIGRSTLARPVYLPRCGECSTTSRVASLAGIWGITARSRSIPGSSTPQSRVTTPTGPAAGCGARTATPCAWTSLPFPAAIAAFCRSTRSHRFRHAGSSIPPSCAPWPASRSSSSPRSFAGRRVAPCRPPPDTQPAPRAAHGLREPASCAPHARRVTIRRRRPTDQETS